MIDHNKKHKRILDRIFHSPSTSKDGGKLMRQTEKLRLEKLHREKTISILGHNQNIASEKMNQQISNILSQLDDIQTISKFHDEHFQLQHIISTTVSPLHQSSRTHISFKLKENHSNTELPVRDIASHSTQKRINFPLSKASVGSLNNISQVHARRSTQPDPIQSLHNISQTKSRKEILTEPNIQAEQQPFKSPILSRDQLFDVLKKHQIDSINGTFSFRRFQKQFEQYWSKRVEDLDSEERQMLQNLQNHAVKFKPDVPPKQDRDSQFLLIQDKLKEEFEQTRLQNLNVKTPEQVKIVQQVQANRKSSQSKPILQYRIEKYIKQQNENNKRFHIQIPDHDVNIEVQEVQELQPHEEDINDVSIRSQELNDEAQQEVEVKIMAFKPGRYGQPVRVSKFQQSSTHDEHQHKSSTISAYSSLQEIFIKQAQDILTDQQFQSQNSRLKDKIEKVFKISINELIDDMSKQSLQQARPKTTQKVKINNFQKNMMKCDEILEKQDFEIPNNQYQEIKSRIRNIKRLQNIKVKKFFSPSY